MIQKRLPVGCNCADKYPRVRNVEPWTDTLAIPGGSWFEHHNTSDKEPLFLFVASDEPTLKKLDLYKKWGKDADGVAGRIE